MTERVSAERFIDALTSEGVGPYFGVPCSFLRPFIDYVIDRDDLGYLAATNEGEALAIAAGAELAGRLPVVMLQNAGLGNLVNPLSSLMYTFRIPALIIVTLRGEPGTGDEPQHELMGRTTRELLDLMEVRNEWFPATDAEVGGAVARAVAHMRETQLPFAFVLRKNVVGEYTPRARARNSVRAAGTLYPPVTAGEVPSRAEAVALIADAAPDALFVATTGKTGRELYEHRDRPGHLYVVGSMGCASSIALGVARESAEQVVVLDGDGAALMRLEAMASIGACAPRRLVHLVLDNGAYESTGGQVTISASVRFPEIAAAVGYASACSVTGAEPLRAALRRAMDSEGPHLIHTHVGISTATGLGRPGIAPPEVARRFRAEVARRAAPAGSAGSAGPAPRATDGSATT